MTDWKVARELLEEDRVWSAYALADLDPHLRHLSDFWLEASSLLLRFRGLTPPVLFAFGKPALIRKLCAGIDQAEYIFTFDLAAREALDGLLLVEHELEMHRMHFSGSWHSFDRVVGASRLTIEQVDDILDLFRDQPDRPDAFHPSQLDHGSFFGLILDGQLVSIAGTHVVSEMMSVAALGNVFTHPDWRGRGYGKIVSGSVVKDLLSRGIETIVLNTQVENEAAVQLYHGLGFENYCRYMEGAAYGPV